MTEMDDTRKKELYIITQFFKSIAKEAQESKREFPLVPRVTGMVYDCPRRIYYSLTTPIDIIDLKGAIRTWIGRKLHETQFLENSEMELELCWEVDGKKILVGHIDEYDESQSLILDKKTTRNIPKEVYEHHKKQVELYNFLLYKVKKKIAKYGAVMYINVDDANIKVFVFKLQTNFKELEEEVLKKYKIIEYSIKTNILPPRIVQQWAPGSIGLVCHYCPYFGRCWQEELIDILVKNKVNNAKRGRN